MTVPAHRRTQEERSTATRQRVLEATITVLIRDGYAAASTSAIQAEAGVSRGALTHQFRSKQELLTAAIGHLAQTRGRAVRASLADLPEDEGRLPAVVGLVWDEFDSDLFRASLELWNAARTDAGLQEVLLPAERRLGRENRAAVQAVLGDLAEGEFNRAFAGLMAYLRGVAVADIVRGEHIDRDFVVASGTRIFTALLRP